MNSEHSSTLAASDVPVAISSSDEERHDSKTQSKRNPNSRGTSHRRYKSQPGTGHPPVAPPAYQPGSARAPVSTEFAMPPIGYYQHPFVSGYDVQWSAYGMYVHSTVMSKRSEKPTRIVFIGSLSPTVADKQVTEAASKFGPIRGVDSSLREYWFGMFVSYWDTRHAEEAVRGIPDLVPGAGSDDTTKVQCFACFIVPPSVAGMENQGLLTVHIGEGVTSTIIRKLFSQFGDVKSVRSINDGAKAVEFYDARAAETAVLELKSSTDKAVVRDIEFASVAPPEQTSNSYNSEAAALDGEASMWHIPSAHYQTAWGQYPPHYSGDTALQRQHSAPAGYSDQHYPVHSHDPLWSAHSMGYHPHGMVSWPYLGAHPSPSMPMGLGTGHGMHRIDSHPGSPGYESHAHDNQSWRPHRTRSNGDRSYDPAQFQFNIDEANDPSAARTTLMIRNIPNKYSQKMLLDVLNKKYSRKFDFFYLPIDFKNRCNLGYAFVNFIDAATTVEFYKEFHTKSWEEFNSKKVCEITYARVQGRDCLIEHFRNSRFPCNDPDYLPLVFEIEEEGEKPVSKGTPVHHWGTNNYTENNAAVAAH